VGAPDSLVLSCEHASARIPPAYRSLFAGAGRALASHRGFDPGALPLARALARRLAAPLYAGGASRLLVDLNRSEGHPRHFSEGVARLPAGERERLLARHYRPHRARVELALRQGLRGGRSVLHVGVHSFAPVWRGVPRAIDLGLLYDPRRPAERALAGRWKRALLALAPGLRVRRNAPYRGRDDGLTTSLRDRLGPRYLGFELEVSQRLLTGGTARRKQLAAVVAASLGRLLGREA
jgi:predicted N-formylglutamate amidohydrolase